MAYQRNVNGQPISAASISIMASAKWQRKRHENEISATEAQHRQ
jgi:hypothetical protein